MPAPLPQLVDPANYVPCDWNLSQDEAGRRHWVAHFCNHLELLCRLIVEEYAPPPGRLAQFRTAYLEIMQAARDAPARFGRVDVLLLDELRHELLTRFAFDDPFARIKRRENARALYQLPDILAELDRLDPSALIAQLVRGLLAGNLFDLGAQASIDRYHSGETEFSRARECLAARPWFVDDLDGWTRRCQNGAPHRHLLFFVDNAGGDVCLGCLSLVRWFLARGSRVTLAANSRPALNDVTADELETLLERAAELDAVLAEAGAAGRLGVVGTGNTAPLIDLSRLAAACVRQVADADLVWLHGMGRAIESNLHARFACDVVRTAVLKDEAVAKRVGGRLFDCVFQYQPARRMPHAPSRP